jgi:hypothetical protein
MMHRPLESWRSLLVGSTALLVMGTGCNLLNPGACGYETRQVTTEGQSQGSAQMSLAKVVFGQSTETWRKPSVDVTVNPAPSAQHLTSIRLLDRRRPSEPLLDHSGPTEDMTGNRVRIVEVAGGDVSERIFETLSAGHGVLVIVGASGSADIEVPLSVQSSRNWHRARCD